MTFSLAAFAARGGPGGPVDGWGIAYHDGHDVRLYREPEPANNSAWLAFVERQQTPSNLVISHIRKATQGRILLANTQPFMRELGGREHVFAHNGKLSGLCLEKCGPSRRYTPIGDTDSEIAFMMLLNLLTDAWTDGVVPSLEARTRIFAGFAADMRTLGPANILYTDGDALFVHAHRRTQADGSIAAPGLWRLHRRCPRDSEALDGAGVQIQGAKGMQEIFLAASVPLTDEPWTALGDGEVLAIRNGCLLKLD
jgi:glutamine amidotransferase